MGNLLNHAKHELKLLGYYEENPESDVDGDINHMMAKNVLELIEVFSNQGHSGFSAPYCINLFSRLAKFEIVAPLTGEDDEWVDVAEQMGETLWQNKRDGRVFKQGDGRAYFIEGIVWEDEDGCHYTSKDSRVYIESFPYTPVIEYRKDYEDAQV